MNIAEDHDKKLSSRFLQEFDFMAIKDLFLYLDNTKSCNHRMESAISLAKRYDAKIFAIALELKSAISTYVGLEIPTDFSEAHRKAVREAAESVVATFEEMAKAAGVACQTEIIHTSGAKAPGRLSFHARHTDIAFVGQPNPDDPGRGFHEDIMEGIMFGSGRPVYIVPYIGRPQVSHRKAVIAWDGGIKAVRAVNDAIPLLEQRGGEVVVLVINPEQRRAAHGDNPGEDIAAHLSRHGINAKVECYTKAEVSPDVVLLNYVADHGADLLVMGAYGHSRLREKAFGGVTSSILHQMTAPVLMSA